MRQTKKTDKSKQPAAGARVGEDGQSRGVMDGRTGIDAESKQQDLKPFTQEAGEFLTTNQGLRIDDDKNSLKMGTRGPTLLEDFHFREKITHFDHERIPERIVHARGAAAHGVFQVYERLGDLTKANFLQDPSKQTPVFVRFSTVAGSRGSADTPRDVRGFAVKFYTEEGVFDLVGNNMPIFFIQDAIQFPDFVHSVKPEPHNEIPQAASAHDTFWDFAGLTPEITHMLMWVMSDRALPRSYSTMEGFGIHTFRFVNAEGKSRFIKFHWKPLKGMHSLVWDEAQKIAGKDPDFNRRDLYESIEMGNFPEWEFGVQVIEQEDEFKYDFDLLDPTKIVPEELVPVRRIGKLTLNRNPDNFFAETEQVAFHPGHVVPGIDFTNDPLLQGRLFSYIDTQISRIGVNFAELPINKPVCPVSNNQRDGKMRITVNKGRVAYHPNTLASGCPMHSPDALASFHSYAEKIDGQKIRERSPSFADHFSQARLFWNSMTDWEQKHIVDAFSFELNNVDTVEIKERIVNDLLVNVDADLAGRVATNIGMASTAPPKVKNMHENSSPALSFANTVKDENTLKGRKVAILAGPGANASQITELKAQLEAVGAIGDVISRTRGTIEGENGEKIPVDKPAPNAASLFYDAVFIPGGKLNAAALSGLGPAIHFVNEAFYHGKTVGAMGHGVDFLKSTALSSLELTTGTGGKAAQTQGVVTAADGTDFAGFVKVFLEAVGQHRHFERQTDMVPA